MLRPSFAVLALVCGLSPALAQEAPPATEAPAAAPADVTVDPAAGIGLESGDGALLTGLYATLATLDICGVDVPEPAATAMSAHRQQLETGLSLDTAAGQTAYDGVRADVESTSPDCAEGSADLAASQAVIDVYNGAGAATPTPVGAEPPAAPAETPAAPAQ